MIECALLIDLAENDTVLIHVMDTLMAMFTWFLLLCVLNKVNEEPR